MSASTETLLNQYLVFADVNDVEAGRIVSRLAELIVEKQCTLLQFIQTAGDYLTRTDDAIRSRAGMCLTLLLEALCDRDPHVLSGQDVAVLVDFLLLKLDDLVSNAATLRGLATLVRFTRFTSPSVAKILQALSTAYDPKRNLAPVRYHAFALLAAVLARFAAPIAKTMTVAFATAFLHVASGEKDPRNLLLLFELQSTIGAKLPPVSEELTNELFDVAFCYFPIAFTPPKNDPYKITSSQLKAALRAAVASNLEYAKDAFPNLIEKLTTTNAKVKLDVLDTILQCVETYPPALVEPFWLLLWNALKFELVHPDRAAQHPNDGVLADEESQGTARVLQVLTALTVAVQRAGSLAPYLETVLGELMPNTDARHKLFTQSALVLACVAEASPEAFDAVAAPMWAAVLAARDRDVRQQRAVIRALGFFLHAYPATPHLTNALVAHKDDLLALVSVALLASSAREVSLRVAAVALLARLAALPAFLSAGEVAMVLRLFNDVILADDTRETRDAVVAAYVALAQDAHLQQAVVETALPVLMDMLPVDGAARLAQAAAEIMAMVVQIATRRVVAETVCARLLTKALAVGRAAADLTYAALLVDAATAAVLRAQTAEPFLTNLWLDTLVPQALALNKALAGRAGLNLLEAVGRFVHGVYRRSSVEGHQALADAALASPLAPSLLKWTLAALDQSVTVPAALGELLLDQVTGSGADNSDASEDLDLACGALERIVRLETLAVVVNKFGGDVEAWFERLACLTARAAPEGVQALETMAWIAKGLLLRDDARAAPYVAHLLELLAAEHGAAAARALEIAICDLELFAAREPQLVAGVVPVRVRLLYKQKFFERVVPPLVEGFALATAAPAKAVYLGALTRLLRHVSRAILLPHLTTFLPLLIQSVSVVPDDNMRHAALSTIALATQEMPALVALHLLSVVPLLMTLARAQPGPGHGEAVRHAALNCLLALATTVELSTLMPYRAAVLRGLELVLDDRKRAVRKAACDARQAFYEL